MADKTKTLDVRISAALDANGTADRDILVSLLDESFDEINSLEEIIKVETPRIMDLSNPDPDKSTTAVTSAKLKIERLKKAIPLLQARVDTIDAEIALAEYNTETCRMRDKSDELYEKLEALYRPFVQEMLDLMVEIFANHVAFNEHKDRAPVGADTRYARIEPRSRFWDNMQLPSWTNVNLTYPPRRTPEQIAWSQQVNFVNAMCAQTKAIEAKHAQMHSPDWAAVHDEINKRKAAEDEKAE